MSPKSDSPKGGFAQQGPGGFLVGATYPLRALALFVNQPQMRQYVIFPILLNLLVGLTLYASLLSAGLEAIDAFLAAVPTWLAEASHVTIDWSGWTAALPHWSIALPTWLHWPTLEWPDWSIAFPTWLHWPTITWPHWSITLPDWLRWPSLSIPPIAIPRWISELSGFGLAVLIGLLRLVLVLTLLLVTGFLLLQFGVLLGAPWYGQLSEELEKLQTGQLEIVRINPAREIWRAILYELKKLVLGLSVGFLLLLSNIIPGFGPATTAIGGVTLAATIVCLDFLDSALERRRFRFRQKLGIVWGALPASAGFALVCLGLVSIPFINLLAIPLCVAAGTLFFCDWIYPKLKS